MNLANSLPPFVCQLDALCEFPWTRRQFERLREAVVSEFNWVMLVDEIL